jgi:hypothetical protein
MKPMLTATRATLTLAAATPRFAVAAGQRIVLMPAENISTCAEYLC